MTHRDGPNRFFGAAKAQTGGDRNAAADIAKISAIAAPIEIRHSSIRIAGEARNRSRSPGLGHANSLDSLFELHDGHEKPDDREGEGRQCDGHVARVSWTPAGRGPHSADRAEARLPGWLFPVFDNHRMTGVSGWVQPCAAVLGHCLPLLSVCGAA